MCLKRPGRLARIRIDVLALLQLSWMMVNDDVDRRYRSPLREVVVVDWDIIEEDEQIIAISNLSTVDNRF